jgi:phage-related protein/DNA-binding XRE family transcriptional regulator
MDEIRKPLVWLHSEVKTPPFGVTARIEAGFLLRQLQQCENLGLPHSRPITSIGGHCHELRVRDQDKTWRIIYRIDDDAIMIVEVFRKTTRTTPKTVIEVCQKRLVQYDRDQQE